MARKWLEGASKRSRRGSKVVQRYLEGHRRWIEAMASKLRSFLSRVLGVLEGDWLTLEGEDGALELEMRPCKVLESTRGKGRGWADLKLEGGEGTFSTSLSGPRARAQKSNRAWRTSRRPGDGLLKPAYPRRGGEPLDTLECDSKEAGAGFDIRDEDSRSKDKVPWGGFKWVSRGEEGFEGVFEDDSRRGERVPRACIGDSHQQNCLPLSTAVQPVTACYSSDSMTGKSPPLPHSPEWSYSAVQDTMVQEMSVCPVWYNMFSPVQ
ncbi:hypothetical protein BKA83DRAFT_4523352 [Pisolithus microcarpus]|nr:hypothetical protein BKA83DRAFT_4523352 [Pisolithus microcarpus]